MKNPVFSVIMLLISVHAFSQDLIVNELRCENKTNPIGIDVIRPRFSWKISASGRNVLQTSCIIRVSEDKMFRTIKWQSGTKGI
jgi:alpha-L-rhamnosidase